MPLEKAWQLWEDRELIPKWMPWIRSVTAQPDNPTLSRWLLATHQFGRDWEFSWLAQNLTPMQHQKVRIRQQAVTQPQVSCTTPAMAVCPSGRFSTMLLRRSIGGQYQVRQAAQLRLRTAARYASTGSRRHPVP